MSERSERAKAMRADGFTFAEIGEVLGVSRQAAQRMVQRPPATKPKIETRGRKRKVFDTQRCWHCKKILPIEEFTTAPSRVSGRSSICRPCNAIRSREQSWAKLTIEQLEALNAKELEVIRLREEHIQKRRSK